VNQSSSGVDALYDIDMRTSLIVQNAYKSFVNGTATHDSLRKVHEAVIGVDARIVLQFGERLKMIIHLRTLLSENIPKNIEIGKKILSNMLDNNGSPELDFNDFIGYFRDNFVSVDDKRRKKVLDEVKDLIRYNRKKNGTRCQQLITEVEKAIRWVRENPEDPKWVAVLQSLTLAAAGY
jgi:hypothetical protein